MLFRSIAMTSRGRMALIYGMAVACGLLAGYLIAVPRDEVSPIYLIQPPTVPADLTFGESLFPDQQPGLVSSWNMAMITERNDQDPTAHIVRYWCPRSSNTWGEIIYEWKWDADWDPELAIMKPNLHVFSEFDPLARGEFYIATASTRDQWILMLEIGESKSDTRLNREIDVTRWVRNSRYLRVKYRLKAQKMMYHPTPNDPIGFAGAHAMRDHIEDPVQPPYAMYLSLWRHRPPEPTKVQSASER